MLCRVSALPKCQFELQTPFPEGQQQAITSPVCGQDHERITHTHTQVHMALTNFMTCSMEGVKSEEHYITLSSIRLSWFLQVMVLSISLLLLVLLEWPFIQMVLS